MASTEIITDFALGILSKEPEVLKEKMKKYNSTHVFVTQMEEYIVVYWLKKFEGNEYITANHLNENFSELLLSRMLDDQEIEGFNEVYSDDFVKIYALSS